MESPHAELHFQLDEGCSITLVTVTIEAAAPGEH